MGKAGDAKLFAEFGLSLPVSTEGVGRVGSNNRRGAGGRRVEAGDPRGVASVLPKESAADGRARRSAVPNRESEFLVGPDALTPYPFQEADIQAILDGGGSGFVVAETGAGKTLIATEVMRRSSAQSMLIVAVRSTIRDTWTEGIIAQDPSAKVYRLDGTKENAENWVNYTLGMPGYYICTHSIFTLRAEELNHGNPDQTIVDEAHLLSNRDSAGGKALRRFRSRARLVMSGTMFRNRFDNFWNLLRWVYPKRDKPGDIADKSYWRWCQKWCRMVYDHFKQSKQSPDGELVPGALAAAIPVYVQHFKRQRCCEFHPNGFLDLPEPIEIRRILELTPAQKRMIKQMETDYIAWLEDNPTVAKLPVTARMRIRQMTLGVPSVIPATEDEKEEVYFDVDCESPTLDDIEEWLKAHPDEKVLFLAQSQKFLAEATRRFSAKGYKAFEWSGMASEVSRDKAKEAFKNGDLQLVFGQVQSIGTGIDGLQSATNILWSLETGDDATTEIQAEGRLDRRGQVRGVVHIKSIRAGSLDEGVVGKQLEKRLAMNASLKRELRRA